MVASSASSRAQDASSATAGGVRRPRHGDRLRAPRSRRLQGPAPRPPSSTGRRFGHPAPL